VGLAKYLRGQFIGALDLPVVWVKAPGLLIAAVNVSEHYNAHLIGIAMSSNTLRNCFLTAGNYLVSALSGQVTVNFKNRFIKLSL
jgi:hypothetical protein